MCPDGNKIIMMTPRKPNFLTCEVGQFSLGGNCFATQTLLHFFPNNSGVYKYQEAKRALINFPSSNQPTPINLSLSHTHTCVSHTHIYTCLSPSNTHTYAYLYLIHIYTCVPLSHVCLSFLSHYLQVSILGQIFSSLKLFSSSFSFFLFILLYQLPLL